MDQNDSRKPEVLKLGFVLRLTFLLGLGCGAILMPIPAFRYLMSGEIVNVVLVVVFSPLANGVIAALYGLVGYPLYRYLAGKGKLGVSRVELR